MWEGRSRKAPPYPDRGRRARRFRYEERQVEEIQARGRHRFTCPLTPHPRNRCSQRRYCGSPGRNVKTASGKRSGPGREGMATRSRHRAPFENPLIDFRFRFLAFHSRSAIVHASMPRFRGRLPLNKASRFSILSVDSGTTLPANRRWGARFSRNPQFNSRSIFGSEKVAQALRTVGDDPSRQPAEIQGFASLLSSRTTSAGRIAHSPFSVLGRGGKNRSTRNRGIAVVNSAMAVSDTLVARRFRIISRTDRTSPTGAIPAQLWNGKPPRMESWTSADFRPTEGRDTA